MSIKKSISFVFGAQLVNTVIGFVSSVIVTRILGAEGRGDNAIFTNSVSFAVLFFGFSISSTIPYFINSGKAKAEELLSTIIIFSITSSLMVFAALSVLEHFGRLHFVLSSNIQSTRYKLIFTGIYFCTLLNGILSTYLLSYKKFKQVSLYTIAFQFLPLLIYFLLYLDILPYNHADPFPAIVNIVAVVSLLSMFAVIILFRKNISVRPSGKILSAGLMKQFLFFSTMAYIGNIATFLNYKLDFWVVDKYCGKAELGIYSLAAQLAQLLWIIPQSFSSVLYSYASKCTEQEAVNYAIRLKQIAFYATLVLGLAGIVLAYFFIPVLYGKQFSYAFNLLAVFVIGVIPFSLPSVLASLFAARGNFRMSFIVSLIIFIIASTLYFTLIPRYGLMGGAVASAIAYFAGSVISEIWFCREFKVPLLNLFTFEPGLFSIKKISYYLKRQ